ncbi:MAG: hypothetical protein KIT45_14645 [Fimbriimonadia bacterium]|nr:hypothetical protein [Fimbriimonadia bacterium]
MKPCQIEPVLIDDRHELVDERYNPASEQNLLTRRHFLQKAFVTTATLTCADFLSYFLAFGLPSMTSRAHAMTQQSAQQNTQPQFLIQWFLEGGWLSYDMFSPVETPNHVLNRLANVSEERYRVLKWGEDNYRIKTHGNIRYGYLAEDGKDLFKEMAVLSSMSTGTFHSGDRLRAHMGHYRFELSEDRAEDERSVMQAFCEVYGQSYALPNISWHYWTSDGELNEAAYTGRKGYYHALGPVWAHTIYAGTPYNLRRFLLRLHDTTNNAVHKAVQAFVDDAQQFALKDTHIEAVKSYASAAQIYKKLMSTGYKLDKGLISRLFTDPALREKFQITPEDEMITYTSINGNKARTKFAPMTNVQALMTYDLMRHGLSCGFWIESRDIRLFDSHRSRKHLWNDKGEPNGQSDQTDMMRRHLWNPLKAFVELLKTTEVGRTGKSYYDCTTIVLNSEFGRSIHGAVDDILKMNLPEDKKKQMIDDQDICQHWPVTSCAFLGGNVKGNTQFGGAGEKTLMPVPILPDGSMDPAYDPRLGDVREGKKPAKEGFVPNHGHVYATALYLSGIDPKGKGRNQAPPLKFIHRRG